MSEPVLFEVTALPWHQPDKRTDDYVPTELKVNGEVVLACASPIFIEEVVRTQIRPGDTLILVESPRPESKHVMTYTDVVQHWCWNSEIARYGFGSAHRWAVRNGLPLLQFPGRDDEGIYNE